MTKDFTTFNSFNAVDDSVVQGVAAAVAIVACADLRAGLREAWMLRRASKVIDTLSQLPRQEIIAAYKAKVALIEQTRSVPSEIWVEMSTLATRPDLAKLAGQLCFDVMCADGDMDAFEIKDFVAVCQALGLDAKRDFGIV